MNPSLNRKLLFVWGLLCGATLLSTLLSSWQSTNAIAAAVLGIAFIKVYLVMRYFMELGEAPRLWHHLFLGWVIVTFSLLLVFS